VPVGEYPGWGFPARLQDLFCWSYVDAKTSCAYTKSADNILKNFDQLKKTSDFYSQKMFIFSISVF